MAMHFSGGTDRLSYGGGNVGYSIGCFSFWMKTTQTTSNTGVIAIWNNSRTGFGFILNNTAGKLLAQGYDLGSTESLDVLSATTVNDGNWHHVGFNFNVNNGTASTLFIDGAQDATANATAGWSITSSSTPLQMGDLDGSFWASYVGDIAETALWTRNLDAAEIAALAKGFSPSLIAETKCDFYEPLVRDPKNLRNAAISTFTATVSDHPRVIGR